MSTRWTCIALHSLRPGAVGMPRRFSSPAICLRGTVRRGGAVGPALDRLEKAFASSYLFLAASNAHLCRNEEAPAAMTVALQLRPDLTIDVFLSGPPRRRFPERTKLWIDGMRMAAMPEG